MTSPTSLPRRGPDARRRGLVAAMAVALLAGCAGGEWRVDRGGTVEAWLEPPRTVRLTQDTEHYRVFGGEAARIGAWVTPDRPLSASQAREELALPPQNAATHYAIVRVPQGVAVRVGRAAPAFGQPGGGRQVELIDRLPASHFSEPIELAP